MKTIATILLSISIIGCAQNVAYRDKSTALCNFGDQKCDSSLEVSDLSQADPVANSKILLSFIEINDQGLLRERPQLDSTIDAIKRRGKDQTILLFVHGWHHNAKADDRDVKIFRKMLNQYADLHKNKKGSAKVTGVYIGWRGDSWLAPSFLSFWDRKNVSIEVGQGALVEVLSLVEREASETKSRMISIGHSFGGSALFNASRNVLTSRTISAPAYLEKLPFPDSATIGDITIIVNPAFEAMQYWPLYSGMKNQLNKHNGQPRSTSMPRMLILQGQRDWATRYAFPLGRAFVYPFESRASDSDSRDGSPKYKEWRLDMFGIGHFNGLNTHDLVAANDFNIDWSNCGKDIEGSDLSNGTWISPNTGISINPRDEYIPNYPYWIVYDKSVIKKHNDMDNPRIQCMALDLINTYIKTENSVFK